MPPIVIGGVVLVLVACVGLLVATSGPSDEGGDTSIDPSKWTYFGVELGTLSRTEHGVSGKVYAATDSLICITEFNYDGTGPGIMQVTTEKWKNYVHHVSEEDVMRKLDHIIDDVVDQGTAIVVNQEDEIPSNAESSCGEDDEMSPFNVLT
ncbi:uncharacterized protein LOC144134195 [Amblyomma americanum]